MDENGMGSLSELPLEIRMQYLNVMRLALDCVHMGKPKSHYMELCENVWDDISRNGVEDSEEICNSNMVVAMAESIIEMREKK